MKAVSLSSRLGLATLLLAAGPFALAQDSGWYLGANLGQSKATIDDPKIISGLAAGGYSTTSIKDNDRDTAFKIYGGYQFNRFFSFEAGYFKLGKFDFLATTVPAGTLAGATRIEGGNFDGVLSIPFTPKFSAFGRLGITRAQAEDTFAGTGAVNVLNPNPSRTAWNPKAGVGLQYLFTPAVGLRVEAERFRISDSVARRGDIDMLSAGLVVRFGRTARYVAPEPAPVVAPAPEPVAVVVAPEPAPAPVKTQIYCSVLDLQFSVDNAEISADDKENLKVVGVFMTKYPETTAVIEGHTDNVGTPEHNLKLSQQRADSVVNYLQKEFAIAPSRLKAVGYGIDKPLADNATEEGKRQNRRINAVISCASDLEGLTVMPARVTMALAIDFDTKSAAVQPQYDNDLAKIAKFMKANPSVTAVVEGHTGNLQTTPELAMAISLERAKNVVTYLADHFAIDRSRLTAQGFGKTQRFAYNDTAEGRQENRRVNIIFTYAK